MQTQQDLAALTPVTRDRFVDFLRAASILVVVLGHWLMAVIEWKGGRATGSNALDTVDGVWAATWFLQVMPIFFFVGGFSNAVAWDSARRRGEGWAEFMRSRLIRLLKPTALFAACGLIAFTAFRMLGAGGEAFEMAATLSAKPLWFLAVYVMAIAAAPLMLSLHRRFNAAAVVGLLTGAVVVDAARIVFDVPLIGFANFAFVWLIPHQLGFFYADGRLQALSRRALWMWAAAGLGALALLTTAGPYAGSMVGGAAGAGEINNNTPPSVALIALTVWLVAAALLIRPRVGAWLQRPKVWGGVVAANAMIMTVFLWHLPAMFVVAAVMLPAGIAQPEAGSLQWWLLRPVWIGAAALTLAPLVAVFGRVERQALLARQSSGPANRGSNVAAAVATVAGLAALAQWGFGHSVLRPATTTLLIVGALYATTRPSLRRE